MTVVSITAVNRDEGTVVYFDGRDDDGCPVSVVVDHRMARAIREALVGGPVDVTVEPWQVHGHARIPLSHEERVALRTLELLRQRGVLH